MQLIDAFVHNPVKVAVGVLLVSLFGLVAVTRMPMQLTPEVQTPTITIETRWPGASPQEVEQEIILEQEEQLKGVEGVRKMTSESMDSVAKIILEYNVGTNMEKAVVNVIGRLEQVPEYPEDSDKPVITTANANDRPIAWFILGAKPPTEEEIRAFQQRYPQIGPKLDPVLTAHNVGVAMLRLRLLAKEHPEVKLLMPARMPSEEELVEFTRKYPELSAPIEEVLAIVRGQSQAESAENDAKRGAALARLRELSIDNAEIEALIKLEVEKLRRFAEDEIEARFERVEGVSQSNVIGGLEDELQVVVNPEKLAARNLTIGDVRNVLRSQNEDSSAGDYWEGKRRYVTRTMSRFRSPQQVEEQLLATRGGAPVYVRDVAEVRHGYKKPDGLVRRFGESSIAVNALRETGANVLDVMAGLGEVAEQLNREVLEKDGLQLVQVYDETEYIYSSVDLVQQNIFVGGALTMIVLMAFLHLGVRSIAAIPLILVTALCSAFISPWFFVITLAIIIGAGFWFARGALVVGLAIPTSIIGTFLILGVLGRSLNVISLAGMAFAVGMLVDNAVVVLENIYRRYSLGEGPFEAATKGTQEVLGAIVSSTLTTIAVFLPIVFVQEEAGQLFRDIALAITAAVTLSLVVSMTLIPTASARLFHRRKEEDTVVDHDVPYPAANTSNGHAEEAKAAHSARRTEASTAETGSWLDETAGALVAPIQSIGNTFVAGVVALNNWIQRSLTRRVAVVALSILLSIGMSFLFWPKVEYLPSGNRNLVFGILLPPPGYNLDKLMEMGEMVETTLKPYWDVEPGSKEAEALDYPMVGDFFFVARGRQVFMGVRAQDPSQAAKMVDLIQNATRQFPGTFGIAKQSSLFEQGLSAGRTIEVEIVGPDLEKLVALGGQVLGATMGAGGKPAVIPNAQARPIPSLDLSSPETHITPKLVQAAEMGVNSSDLGYAANALIDGAYAGDYLYQGDKIDLTIVGDETYAQSYQDVKNLPVATPIGEVVPLEAVAMVTLSSGPEQVNHRERVRAITIEISPPQDMALEDALVKIQREIIDPIAASGQLSGGYRMNLAGTADKLATMQATFLGHWSGFNADSFISIMTSQFMLVILITYLLMAALFESWLYPLVIIVSVPLGAVGGILGLNLLNVYLAMTGQMFQQLDVLTMLGFVILIGTVVNNPILIGHQSLNHMRDDGMAPRQAILESVRTRIRPIFMTTTTTVLGLLPLVLFPGSGSELYRGLGSVVLGGLVVSTLVTLVLVPSLFSLTMDIREAFVGGGDSPSVPPQRERAALPEPQPEEAVS